MFVTVFKVHNYSFVCSNRKAHEQLRGNSRLLFTPRFAQNPLLRNFQTMPVCRIRRTETRWDGYHMQIALVTQ